MGENERIFKGLDMGAAEMCQGDMANGVRPSVPKRNLVALLLQTSFSHLNFNTLGLFAYK